MPLVRISLLARLRKLFGLLTCLLCVGIAAQTAWADTDTESGQPHLLGKFAIWSVYKMNDQGADVCYMVTEPDTDIKAATASKKSTPKRGKTYLMVTERPIERSFDVVSYAAGTSLSRNSPVTISIDGKKFNLFTDGSFAWTRDSSSDRTLTAALRAGQSVKIDADTAKNKKLHDSYSLKGASAAYKAMAEACGIAAAGQTTNNEAH